MKAFSVWRAGRAAALALLLVLFLDLFDQSGSPARAQSPEVSDDVTAALADEGRARVLVALHEPEPGADLAVQIQAVEEQQAATLAALPEAEFALVHRYETLPGLVGEVTAAGLESLLAQPEVAAVSLDLPVEIALAESAAFIHANTVWQQYHLTGAGVNVAVIDSGVDTNHPDLADHVVAERCFSKDGCPGGANEGDSAMDENGHGTHVAGIITGRGATGPQGIAPDAGIVAVRVLNRNGTGATSDVLAGIDWAVANQAGLNIKVINLSVGGGNYGDSCDETDANTRLYAAAVTRAREAGITVFAASGNSGYTEGMMAPACVSGVMAIGNVYDSPRSQFSWPSCTDQNAAADQIPCSSNSSAALDLLAPGVSITAAAPGGGQATRSGTSMSTPHAAAVTALLLQADPQLGPAELETILMETGRPVTDGRNGRVTPRLDALAAVSRVAGGSTAPLGGTVLLAGRTNHSGTQIFLSDAPCNSASFGDPVAITGADGRFEIGVTAGQSYQCLRAERPGYLSGQADTPRPGMGTITLPGGEVTGDGVIDIYDLALVGQHYNTNHPQADINADGIVNIFDLVLPASHFGQRGPITDWR